MLGNKRTEDSSPPWLAIADIMTVLMVLFLMFFVVYFVSSLMSESGTRADVKVNLQSMISSGDIANKAFVDEDGTLHLIAITFGSGGSNITTTDGEIIRQQFPQFIEQIAHLSNEITKIRIEGHTDSSPYSDETTELGSYIRNYKLSQDRSMEVLTFILTNLRYNNDVWFYNKLTASGRSYNENIWIKSDNTEAYFRSELVSTKGFTEHKGLSRRVSFGFDLRNIGTTERAKNIMDDIRGVAKAVSNK